MRKTITFLCITTAMFLVLMLSGCVSTGYYGGYGSSGYYGGSRYYGGSNYYNRNSWDYDRHYRSGVNRHYDRSQVRNQAQKAQSRARSGGGRGGGRRR